MVKARFISPMLLLKTDSSPTVTLYPLRLDGYRTLAFKRGGTVHLRSRNDKDFAIRYPAGGYAQQSTRDEQYLRSQCARVDGP